MMDLNSNQKSKKTTINLPQAKLIDVPINIEKLHKKASKNNDQTKSTNIDRSNGLEFLYW